MIDSKRLQKIARLGSPSQREAKELARELQKRRRPVPRNITKCCVITLTVQPDDRGDPVHRLEMREGTAENFMETNPKRLVGKVVIDRELRRHMTPENYGAVLRDQLDGMGKMFGLRLLDYLRTGRIDNVRW